MRRRRRLLNQDCTLSVATTMAMYRVRYRSWLETRLAQITPPRILLFGSQGTLSSIVWRLPVLLMPLTAGVIDSCAEIDVEG